MAAILLGDPELTRIGVTDIQADNSGRQSVKFEEIYQSDTFAVIIDTCCKVEKLDCVGHVQKSMGKHLMNLKSSGSDGRPRGSRA